VAHAERHGLGPGAEGDLNGDGFNFNDRPSSSRRRTCRSNPALALGSRRSTAQRYAGYLAEFACVGDHVGQIIPRNTCRNPWFNRLDMTLGYTVPHGGQRSARSWCSTSSTC
jgi:hypothetical protein